jgi:hypothetical protein
MFIDDLSVIKITLVGIPFFEKSKHRYTLVWKTHPAYVDLVCIPSIKHNLGSSNFGYKLMKFNT